MGRVWPRMLFLLAIAAALDSPARASAEADTIAKLFADRGVEGTLIIASRDDARRYVYNEARAGKRFSPASTFKIVNTLIALDQGVVTSKDSIFEWDGVVRDVPAWNHDQTLASALAVSCVWCYQQVARQVGAQVYREQLAAIDYGNRQIGDEVDQFWLNGTLRISAGEQVDIIRRILDYALPYRREHIDVLKSIMLVEQGDGYEVHAKTGWTGPKLHVGWFVGWVEAADETWIFALNISMDRAAQSPLRKELVMQSLRALGIL